MKESKEKAIILCSEGCSGEDADLGFEILANLLEALSQREDRPETIICWNNAVKLLIQGSPLLSRLKHLEEKGVEILAGKLCLEELEISDKIAVGKPASMNEILDVLLNKDVISL